MSEPQILTLNLKIEIIQNFVYDDHQFELH